MTRVQLVIPDDDREHFVDQARRAGTFLSAWLRTAARESLEASQSVKRFESPEDDEEFLRSYAGLDGPETEPDWSDHLRVMNEVREQRTAAE